jgi:hypothetical protein
MKTVQIIAPKGYEIDKEKSTFETIVFREKSKNYKDWKLFENFDDLCRANGTTEVDFNRKWENIELDPSTLAFERMKICTKAYNQDWKYNLYDTTRKKWAPIFKVLSSGLGFSGSVCGYASTTAAVGSRLCFMSEETSNHAGQTFTKLFEEFNNAQF